MHGHRSPRVMAAILRTGKSPRKPLEGRARRRWVYNQAIDYDHHPADSLGRSRGSTRLPTSWRPRHRNHGRGRRRTGRAGRRDVSGQSEIRAQGEEHARGRDPGEGAAARRVRTGKPGVGESLSRFRPDARDVLPAAAAEAGHSSPSLDRADRSRSAKVHQSAHSRSSASTSPSARTPSCIRTSSSMKAPRSATISAPTRTPSSASTAASATA